jgi:glycosyltransferase involved in cell wall biosynthesis
VDILFLIPTLQGGGAERSLVELIRGFSREGVKARLAVFDLTGAVFLSRLPADCSVIDLRTGRTRTSITRVLRLVWKLRPEILFVTLSHANLLVGLIRGLLPRQTICVAQQVTMVSDVSIIGTGLAAKILRLAYRTAYRRFDHIVCVSKAVMEDLRSTLGVDPDKLSVIYNPIDLNDVSSGRESVDSSEADRFFDALPENSTVLVGAGSLIFTKGFDILIDALALCDEKRLHAIVLGEGPLRPELERRAVQKSVSDQIHFVGFKSDPYNWFKKADWFVLSSRMEGFGNVVIEALACGLPVIACPAGGAVSEVLPRVPGCIVAAGSDPASLATAIRLAVGDERPEIQRDFLSEFELPHISREYLRTLELLRAPKIARHAVSAPT